jgi:predicted ATPase
VTGVQTCALPIFYKAQDPSSNSRTTSELAAVLLDGTNLGLASDGTLRALEIMIHLIRKGATCLLIEEPEAAIHPGLLERLLSFVTSYSLDRQIILTTHAPQVVDWCKPSQLRLVARRGSTTEISAFEDARKKLIELYLHDHGTLSDYLYRQSHDSDD